MCGIAAVVSDENLFRLSDLGLMMHRVSHRGPDGFGFLFEATQTEPSTKFINPYQIDDVLTSEVRSRVLLGHARLSIIDLDGRSSQPMCSANKRYGLVFNGEIYNYLEIKDELRRLGYTFNTEGDSEVLLNALIHWGVKALDRLRGMFSIVFVDFVERNMLVARDRFGIKPLYRWKSPAGFLAFASEIKQFSCLESWTSIANVEIVKTFMLNGITDYSSQTFFQGVTQVLPGQVHVIDLKTNKEETIRWYSLPTVSEGREEYRETELNDIFDDVIDLHLRSDVEIASCLSGGIDSSLIVAKVAKKLETISGHHLFKTFTAGTLDMAIDESGRAKSTADSLGIENYCTRPSPVEFGQDIDTLMWFQEQPFASASIFAQYRVFKLMKDNQIKVALDGQGADELFAGYDDYLSAFVIDAHNGRTKSTGFKSFQSLKRTGRIDVRSVLYMYFRIILSERVIPFLSVRLNRKHRKFTKSLDSTIGNQSEVSPLPSFNTSDSLVDQIRRHQFSVGLPMLLRFEDRNSMAFSIEARVPYLDSTLVEYAFRIEEESLFQNGETKFPLRSLLHELVPDDVVRQKKKIGFASEEWAFLLANKCQVIDEINKQKEFLELVTSRDFVSLCVRSLHKNEPNKFIWRLYCLALWKRIYGITQLAA
jgi:asparagine synthase (glutamine-hydrolysing)